MTTTTDAEAERAALVADAEERVREARQVLAALWPDRASDDDVLAEVVSMLGALRQAEQALREAAGR